MTASGHREQHRERVDQRLELRGQHHEDHEQRQHEGEVERPAALLQLARLAGQRGSAAAGQDLLGERVQRIERLAQGEAGRQARVEGEGGDPVVVVELPGPDAFVHAVTAASCTSWPSRPRT